jgi:hypothetical protein
MGVDVATPAMAEIQGAAGSAANASQSAPAPSRDQLVATLPAEERTRLAEFEQKVAWVSQYMRSSPQLDAGANAKMGLMAADMDSTVGRAGRMMPWGW